MQNNERRNFTRKQTDLRATVELRAPAEHSMERPERLSLEVMLIDVSPAGFQFVVPGKTAAAVAATSRLFQKGSTAKLEIELAPTGTRISVVGTLAWVMREDRPEQPIAAGVRALPELADAASRRALARWVAVSSG